MHGITNNDGLALADQGAWHGLGTVVAGAMDPIEAARISGIDAHRVRKQPVYRADGTLIEGFELVEREDTGEVFQVPTRGFQVFDNAAFLDLCYRVAHQSKGVAEVETMASVKGGRIVFASLRVGTFTVGLGDADINGNYLTLSNAHDGTQALRGDLSSVRAVCWNTISMVWTGGDNRFRIVHRGDMDAAVDEAMGRLWSTVERGKTFAAQARALGSTMLTSSQRRDFFQAAFERAYGMLPAIEGSPEQREKAARKHDRAESTLRRWVANLEHPNQAVGASQGTAWACLNAVTQWADHESRVRTTRGDDPKTVRLAANLMGTPAKVKAGALEEALALL